MLKRMEKPWSLPKQKVIASVGSSFHLGLSWTEARNRLKKQGPNQLDTQERLAIGEIIGHQFRSPLFYLLLIASLVSFFKGDWQDGLTIVIVLSLNFAIGVIQEFRSAKAVAKLTEALAWRSRVIRDGQEHEVDTRQLVVGDLLKIEAGDRIGADARVIDCRSLQINEASLTGESVPAKKRDGLIAQETKLAERDNMVYQSTLVVSGLGLAVVTATGLKTEIGQIAKEVVEVKKPPTLLQKQLASYSRYLITLALIVAILAFLVGLSRGLAVAAMLQMAISLLVSVVPEGLPVAITVALSVGLIRAFKQHSIIRQLEAAETIGSVSVIAVDKTGTITEGKMMVEQLVTADQQISVSGRGFGLSGRFLVENKPIDIHKAETARLMLELCSLATMSAIGQDDLKRDQLKEHLTDPTETALAVVAAKAGFFAFKQEKTEPELLEIPFDQELRYSVSVHQFGSVNRYIVKGSPEKVLSLSRRVLGPKLRSRQLLKKSRESWLTRASLAASQGYRVIALGYADYPSNEPVRAESVKQLTFVGFVCLADPIRPETYRSVELAEQAGIRVVMITGDHLLTAQSIAEKIGLTKIGQVVDADDLAKQPLEQISVIARATPKEKLRIIERLQKNGQVVAMTGDGVNDAPALKRADIGIAMGRTGTDVAIESASIVLANDNLSTIINAVKEGRLIWENMRKVIFYLSASSLDEALMIMTALVFGWGLPLLAIQILWLNLVTDSPLTLALTVDGPEEDLMKKAPRSRRAFLADKTTIIRMIYISLLMAVLGLIAFRFYEVRGLAYAQTAAVTTVFFCQLANLFNSRSLSQSAFHHRLSHNGFLGSMVILTLILHVMAVNLPLLQRFLHLVSLDWSTWALTAGLGLVVVLAEELRKALRLGLPKGV